MEKAHCGEFGADSGSGEGVGADVVEECRQWDVLEAE